MLFSPWQAPFRELTERASVLALLLPLLLRPSRRQAFPIRRPSIFGRQVVFVVARIYPVVLHRGLASF